MKTINIHGGNGQHGSDLIKRGIFNGFNKKIMEPEITSDIQVKDNLIIIPIHETKKLIETIIGNKSNSSIVNFSGIMSTTPDEFRNLTNISNFHFLFGPKAKKGLKVAIAGGNNDITHQIIINLKEAGIIIIETDIEKHDSIVSITQAFSHLFILLSGFTENTSLINEWSTPNLTILDMILENPFFLSKLEKLIESLRIGDNLSEIFLEHVENVSKIDINNFGTPTFIKVMKLCSKENIIVNSKMIIILNQIRNKALLLKHIIQIKTIIK